MAEHIRYAWGTSSLGPFMAAASDAGLVAFEFADRETNAVEALRARFPEANPDRDEAGLADIVGKLADVVDHPDNDPAIPLDVRGTDYQKQGWKLLQACPDSSEKYASAAPFSHLSAK